MPFGSLMDQLYKRKNYKLIYLIKVMETQINSISLKDIMLKLVQLQQDVSLIKNQMPDKDMFLSNEEKQLLDESYDSERNDTLVSAKEVRKQIIEK